MSDKALKRALRGLRKQYPDESKIYMNFVSDIFRLLLAMVLHYGNVDGESITHRNLQEFRFGRVFQIVEKYKPVGVSYNQVVRIMQEAEVVYRTFGLPVLVFYINRALQIRNFKQFGLISADM